MIESTSPSLTERSEALYREKLQAILEPTHRGEFLAIEPESEDYFLGKDFDHAMNHLRKRHPDRLVFVMRIGYPAAIEIGHAYHDR